MRFSQIVEARYPRTPTSDALAQAEQAGFDTAKLWYHGTRRRFDGFQLPKREGINELGPGVYLTGKKWLANTWARKGGFVVICVIRQGPVFDLAQRDRPATMNILKAGYRRAQEQRWGDVPDNIDDTFDYVWRTAHEHNRLFNACLSGAGYVGGIKHDSQIQDQIVVFQPDDVRIVARMGGQEHMSSFD